MRACVLVGNQADERYPDVCVCDLKRSSSGRHGIVHERRPDEDHRQANHLDGTSVQGSPQDGDRAIHVFQPRSVWRSLSDSKLHVHVLIVVVIVVLLLQTISNTLRLSSCTPSMGEPVISKVSVTRRTLRRHGNTGLMRWLYCRTSWYAWILQGHL